MYFSKSKTILLVEDNIADEELTLMAFEKNGIQNPVAVARDGQEALDYLFCTGEYTHRDCMDLPQVILLDLKLPRINGHEVLRSIRTHEQTKYVPVVILTSSREDKDIIDAYNLGTNAYVQKPVDFSEFTQAAKTLGLFWLLLNQWPEPHMSNR